MSLTVKDLTKRYGDRTVVDRLSFGMPGPGVYALLGTNGAGKTTSIRMMLNMLSRDGGEVLWNGEPLDISRCNVGYLAEERGLYPKYALMDQLLYFASLRDVPPGGGQTAHPVLGTAAGGGGVSLSQRPGAGGTAGASGRLRPAGKAQAAGPAVQGQSAENSADGGPAVGPGAADPG